MLEPPKDALALEGVPSMPLLEMLPYSSKSLPQKHIQNCCIKRLHASRILILSAKFHSAFSSISHFACY